MKTIKNLTADQIRKSILQLAIQGKLVKQDPNDEPASELVKRIYEEKHKLIKEGKIKKDKNESYIYKGDDNCYYEKVGKEIKNITDELPFEIPESWTWVRHNSIFEIFGGSQPPKSKFSKIPKDGYIRLYQIRDYGPNPDPIYIQIKDAHKTTNKGDILLARYGASVGKVFWAENGAYNVAMAKVEKLYESNFIDFNYMYAFYKSPLYQLLVKNNSRSAQAGFNKNDLSELLLPIPPFEEQKRIVKKIQNFEPLIQQYEQREKLLSNLETSFEEKLKASILQYAIEGKLVKQDPNDESASKLLERIKAEKERLIKEGKIKRDKRESEIVLSDDKNYYENIPNNWLAVPLKNLCALITCGYASTPKYEDNGIPFVSAKNVKPNKFIFSNYNFISEELFNKIHRNYVPEIGDILLIRVGAGIGEACIIDVNDKFGIYVSLTLIKPIYKLTNKYLLLVLQSPYGKTLSKKNTYGLDASQGNLNVDKVRKFIIPFPPINEQKRITMKINNIFNIFVS